MGSEMCIRDSLECINLSSDIAEAAENFSADPSVENCNAYRAAIEAFQAEDCTGADDLTETLEGLDCTAG